MMHDRVQDSPEGRQAWCDLQLARCENIKQMLELGYRLLFAEECPRIDELCFEPDVSDPLPDSDSDSDSQMDHSDAVSDTSHMSS